MSIGERWRDFTRKDINYTVRVQDTGELKFKRAGEDYDDNVLASGTVSLERLVPLGGWDLYSVSVNFRRVIGNRATTHAFMDRIMREAVNEFRKH